MSQVADFEPIDVLYKHFHDAIRAELVSLEAALSRLDAAAASGTLTSELQSLKDRYIFLQQIYNYHSSVEDEVCTPPPSPEFATSLLSRSEYDILCCLRDAQSVLNQGAS